MNVSGLDKPVYYSGYGQNSQSKLLGELNDQFGSRVKIVSGKQIRSGDVVETRSTIAIAPELLKKAESDEALRGKIEKSIAKMMDAKECFKTINLTATRVELTGYTMDRNGNLKCLGKNKTLGKDFSVDLGRLTDTGGTSYKSLIYKHFDISASTQFYLASINA